MVIPGLGKFLWTSEQTVLCCVHINLSTEIRITTTLTVKCLSFVLKFCESSRHDVSVLPSKGEISNSRAEKLPLQFWWNLFCESAVPVPIRTIGLESAPSTNFVNLMWIAPSYNLIPSTNLVSTWPPTRFRGKRWKNYFRSATTIINHRCSMDQLMLSPRVTSGSHIDIAPTAAVWLWSTNLVSTWPATSFRGKRWVNRFRSAAAIINHHCSMDQPQKHLATVSPPLPLFLSFFLISFLLGSQECSVQNAALAMRCRHNRQPALLDGRINYYWHK